MAGNSPARAQSSTPAAPTPPSTVLRVTLAVVGAAGLLFGTIAVFSAASGAGAVALLLAGLILVAAAVFLPMYSNRIRLGGGRAAAHSDVSAVAGLLTSPDPLVRLAAAEAVLDPAPSEAGEPAPDVRELAIGVLLERDLVRRVSDLLSRGGYRVVSTGIGAHRSGADVLIAVDDKVLLPVMVNTGSGLDSIAAVQSFSAVANGLASQAAVVIFTGPQAGSPPLGTATTVGGVQVFSVYSPRLGDEPSVQAAVGRALEAAKPAKSALSARPSEPAASPVTPNPAQREAQNEPNPVTEDADSH